MPVIVNGDEILLSGTVGLDWWDDYFTAADVAGALAQVGRASDVTIRLNSGGGLATEGAAIHAIIKGHAGKTTLIVDGIAASAATLVAVAADEVEMSLGATFMIHDPSTITWGTAADHRLSVDMLDTLSTSYAEVYADATGASAEDMRALMKAETWMTAQEAVDQGFADRVGPAAQKAAEPTAFAYGVYAKAPREIRALADANGWRSAPPKPAAKSARPSPAAKAGDKSPAGSPAPTPAGSPAPTPAAPTAKTGKKQEPPMADLNENDVRNDERTKTTARVKAIMTSEEAKGREALAEHLAYDTDQTADAAIALMKVSPKAAEVDDQGASFMQRKAGAGDTLGNPADRPNAKASGDRWKTVTSKVNARNVQAAR